MTRNLIAHIWPGKQHGPWRRSVQHLCARWPMFDGKKILAIAHDESTDSPREVMDEFGIDRTPDIDVLVVKNDPSRGEGTTFPVMLDVIKDLPGQTFYCHTKGASHPPESICQAWADVMFHLCLDYPGRLEDIYPIAGPCQRIEKRMGVDWHYSGTFFWFRNHNNIPAPQTSDRNCVERWPAETHDLAAAEDLGLADCRNLYDEINWRSWVTRRFQKEILWDADRKADRAKAVTDWAALPPTTFQPLQVVYDEFRVTA